jgi:hypothetical protein
MKIDAWLFTVRHSEAVFSDLILIETMFQIGERIEIIGEKPQNDSGIEHFPALSPIEIGI